MQVWLKQPLVDLEAINQRLDIVDAFVGDPTLREALRDIHLRGQLLEFFRSSSSWSLFGALRFCNLMCLALQAVDALWGAPPCEKLYEASTCQLQIEDTAKESMVSLPSFIELLASTFLGLILWGTPRCEKPCETYTCEVTTKP